jgi:hypothetical protein
LSDRGVVLVKVRGEGHGWMHIIFRVFESYKDAQTLRDHRVLQDKAGSAERLWYHSLLRKSYEGNNEYEGSWYVVVMLGIPSGMQAMGRNLAGKKMWHAAARQDWLHLISE